MDTEIIAVADNSLALLAKAEIDQQVATAHAFPRSVVKFKAEAKTLATMDEDTAASCVYALPRSDKPIKGPSIRFAEIIASCWGNLRCGSRIVAIGEKFVTAQGICHDLERNQAHTADVQRRITNKHGQRFGDDMIGVTCNAAASIAKRNAILSTVPKAFWKPIYDASLKVTIGDSTTIVDRRQKALDYWAKLGVIPKRVCWALGVAGPDEIGLDELETLTGWRTAIKENESDIDRIFPTTDPNAPEPEQPKSKAEAKAAKAATKHEAPAAKPSADSSPANEPSEGASVASNSEAPVSDPATVPPDAEGASEPVEADVLTAKSKVFVRALGKRIVSKTVAEMTDQDLQDAYEANEAALLDPSPDPIKHAGRLGVQKHLENELDRRAAGAGK